VAVAVAILSAHLGCSGADSTAPGEGNGADGPRHVVLISIDSLRADHLGAYGHDRATSPALDALAADGVVFEHAISQAPWTLPSMASLLTGLLPSEHGAVSGATPLPDARPTLAESLQERGHLTVGVVSHVFVGSRYGFDRGFEVFDETQIKGHDAVTSHDVTGRALLHLESAPRDRAFFLWVHYFDPHYTYVQHPEFGFSDGYDGELPDRLTSLGLGRILAGHRRAGRSFPERDLDYVRAIYDEEIAYTDLWIGRLLEGLRELDFEGSTLVIVTSDHGQYFLERGRFFHGKDVYEPLVHVPLILGGDIPAALRGVRVSRSVEVASVPRTVMGWVRGPADGFPGSDLIALAAGESVAPRPVVTEGSHVRGSDERRRAVVAGGWKLIHNLDDGSYELYDLRSDPAETRNLWERDEDSAAAARAALLPHLQRLAAKRPVDAPQIELRPEEIEHLESLGYVW
jgi:arylsulfatase A-like enzyme